jgi:N-acetylglucosamine-6-phosphate deacetylase
MEPNQPPRQLVLVADRVFDGARWHAHAAVLIEAGRIVGVARNGDVHNDWPRHELPRSTILAPGFVDLQVNGGGGVLLNDAPTADAMAAIARAHRRFGTTGCLPTFITDDIASTKAAAAAAKQAAGTGTIIGLHLEGPFISPARPGIHPREKIATATMADLDWLSELGAVGQSLVTLAPECVPQGFIAKLCEAGIGVCAGHSEASAEVMARARDEGLCGVTHLHNAMPPMQNRQPGIVGFAMTEPSFTAGLIVDGIHVDPAVVRLTFLAMRDRVALVTDAMPTVGSEKNEFQLQGRRIVLRDGRLTDDAGTLAGAHLDMASTIRIAVTQIGIPEDDALRAASRTPATFLGLSDERGQLRPGMRADLVALDAEFQVLATWVEGTESRD